MFLELQNANLQTLQIIGETMLGEDANCIANHLIKPLGWDAFGRQNAVIAFRINEEALGEAGF